MTFATSKFIKFLPSATFAMAAEFLLGLSDSIICGHVIGETGLAAVNLMQGVFEIVSFVSLLVAIGTSVLFSTEVGAFHIRRAQGYFTLGAAASVAAGLLIAGVLAVARQPVLETFGASKEVFDAAAEYWLWFLPAAALQPAAFYLAAMCYVDGNARLSIASYIVQLVVNCAVSVPLTFALGAAGCAIGTWCGALCAIAALMLHFRREGCLLRLSGHFRVTDLVRIARTSVGDASKNVGKAVLMFALNAFVIAKFGSGCLPVLAVVVITIGISEIFDGVGNAVQPLVSVYVGERNTLLTRRVMRSAIKASLVEGGGAALLFAVFPQLMLMLSGVDDPEIVADAALAVRLVSCSLLGLAVVLLFNSYYVFIGREVLSTVLTLLATCAAPLAMSFAAGSLFGANGMWLALGLAPFAACAVVGAYLVRRNGTRGFPLLIDGAREANIRVFDLALEPGAICGASRETEDYLRSRGVSADRASRAALLVEETLMVVRERNAGRKVRGEVTVDLNDGRVNLVMRDDGEIFDITDADARISSLRVYLVANLMAGIPNRRNLTTTGFNRNTFRL